MLLLDKRALRGDYILVVDGGGSDFVTKTNFVKIFLLKSFENCERKRSY